MYNLNIMAVHILGWRLWFHVIVCGSARVLKGETQSCCVQPEGYLVLSQSVEVFQLNCYCLFLFQLERACRWSFKVVMLMCTQAETDCCLLSSGMLKFPFHPKCLFSFSFSQSTCSWLFLVRMLMCDQSEPDCSCVFQLECSNLFLAPMLLFVYSAIVPVVDYVAGMVMSTQSEPDSSWAFQLEC